MHLPFTTCAHAETAGRYFEALTVAQSELSAQREFFEERIALLEARIVALTDRLVDTALAVTPAVGAPVTASPAPVGGLPDEVEQAIREFAPPGQPLYTELAAFALHELRVGVPAPKVVARIRAGGNGDADYGDLTDILPDTDHG